MNTTLESAIKEITNAESFASVENIQTLWSGYGYIKRYKLINGCAESVIVKHIRFPGAMRQKSDLAHNRKLRSYQVESAWYQKWNQQCDESCRTPYCIGIEQQDDELLIVLEDLDQPGYHLRKHSVSITQMQTCLQWLANFHAKFMGKIPEGIWETGTYWHLATRPDELKLLTDQPLKEAASAIDKILSEATYQTIVHGDAKLANFCFSVDNRVAAVDFQYVGKGCGMKDVAYFIGSCLDENDCERYEHQLLEFYFVQLGSALKQHQPDLSIPKIETEWRELFPVAWTDFHRFYKGWSPGQWHKSSYSEKVAQQVIRHINSKTH